jgi:hypothetical protein
MRVEEIFRENYAPAVSVYLDGVKSQDKSEVAGMLRGLMCAIEGWGIISGLTNDRFSSENPIRLEFSNVANAHYFKECVEYYFADDILERLKVKRRVYSH